MGLWSVWHGQHRLACGGLVRLPARPWPCSATAPLAVAVTACFCAAEWPRAPAAAPLVVGVVGTVALSRRAKDATNRRIGLHLEEQASRVVKHGSFRSSWTYSRLHVSWFFARLSFVFGAVAARPSTATD
ncbi:unnamed protein product [Prorocentrum cordatum]|uniref:Secreted protein n=1 Tax=Prorocentrum cordatum TaxID=2364126 RepID=A0ABN9WJ41_9DINO|nr:unnamed protein product [Polarella glacialis]